VNQQPESYDPAPAPVQAEPEWLRQPPTPGAFLDAVSKGLGRAVLWLKKFDPEPYVPGVRTAFTSWLGYDYLLDPDNTDYLMQLAELTRCPEQIEHATLDSLQPGLDGAPAMHGVRLASHWAKRGHACAKEAIYRLFEVEAKTGRFVGGRSIIVLDGFDGLLYVARKSGGDADPCGWETPETWLWTCVERAGVADAEARLREMANLDARLASFLQALDAKRASARELEVKKSEKRIPTLDEMATFANDPVSRRRNVRGLASDWAHRCPEVEWMQGARMLFSSPGEGMLYALRCAFTSERGDAPFRRFPLGAAQLAAHVDNPDAGLRTACRMILACHPGRVARQTALRLLAAGDTADDVIKMLTWTLEAGDVPLILKAVERTELLNRVALHSVGMDIKHLVWSDSAPFVMPLLRWLYEHTPCGFCRQHAVEEMLRLGPLPRDIALEAACDASLDTRHLVLKGKYSPDEADK
jgi:hypothetical protein